MKGAKNKMNALRESPEALISLKNRIKNSKSNGISKKEAKDKKIENATEEINKVLNKLPTVPSLRELVSGTEMYIIFQKILCDKFYSNSLKFNAK